MVRTCKVNSLVFKSFLPALNQHLFRQNSDTREHNCRKLWTLATWLLSHELWHLSALIRKKKKSPSWGDGVLTTKLTSENEEPGSVLTITNIINNSKTTWGKKHFPQSSKTLEVMLKKVSVFLTEQMYWHLKTKIYRNAVFSEKNRSHPSSFGSHSWGSTDETRNSISCFAHNRGLSKEGVLSFSTGKQLHGELTLHPYSCLLEWESLSLDMIY